MDKKIEELLSAAKIGEFLHTNKQPEPKKENNPYIVALVMVGAVALVAAVAYAVYYFFVPDRVVDFDDDFDEEYEDAVNDGTHETEMATASDEETV